MTPQTDNQCSWRTKVSVEWTDTANKAGLQAPLLVEKLSSKKNKKLPLLGAQNWASSALDSRVSKIQPSLQWWWWCASDTSHPYNQPPIPKDLPSAPFTQAPIPEICDRFPSLYLKFQISMIHYLHSIANPEICNPLPSLNLQSSKSCQESISYGKQPRGERKIRQESEKNLANMMSGKK